MSRIISIAELRLGLRLIARQPIMSATIVLALATGICAAMVGFTVRDALFSSTLPYQAGDRFVRLVAFDREGNRLNPGLDRYHAVRDRAASFDHVGVVIGRSLTVAYGPGDVDSIRGALITPGLMRWVEATPLVGRTLIPADGDPGAERVVLMRESLWRRRHGADPGVVGRQITIAGRPHTVAGIMPDSFRFPESGELWVPLDELTLDGLTSATPGVRMLGVRRPGVSLETANTEVVALSSQVPPTKEPGEVVSLLVHAFPGDVGSADLTVSAVVVVLLMVLLVVASNVATLVLARTWARAPELAVRTALGATRKRIVGQLFVETLVLGSIAAAVGATAASVIFRYIASSVTDLPFWIALHPTPRVVAFAVFLALLVSVVLGVVPAWRVTRHDLRNTLQGGRGVANGGFGRMAAALLIVEIALSVGLLNGAVTIGRAFGAYANEVPALPRNQVLTAHLGRVGSAALRDRVIEAAAALPGVLAVGAGQRLPRQFGGTRPTTVEPIDDEPVQAAMPAPSHAVGSGFLEAVGARALSGRLFIPADFRTGAAPVAVVNEPFVRKFLGGRNPIGRRIRVEGTRDDGTQEAWREIIGVVPDLGLSVANPALAAGFYTPVDNEFLYFLAVRTTTDPLRLTPQLRAAVASIDPNLQLEGYQTLDDAGNEERTVLSAVAAALTMMGGITLMLSIVGIYALLSFMVTRRTREIGIRVALGATRPQVLTTITGRAVIYLAIGGIVGTALGLLIVTMRSVLPIGIPDVGIWMPATIFLMLAIAGGAACALPARRALSIQPAEALSAE